LLISTNNGDKDRFNCQHGHAQEEWVVIADADEGENPGIKDNPSREPQEIRRDKRRFRD
jgi:hypothetical protein